THEVYVGNAISSQVTVINGTAGAIMKQIIVSGDPFWVAVDPETNTIYATFPNTNALAVINGSSNSILSAQVPVCNGPDGIAVDSLTDLVYLACVNSNSVEVVSGSAPYSSVASIAV